MIAIEYKRVDCITLPELQELGKQGWGAAHIWLERRPSGAPEVWSGLLSRSEDPQAKALALVQKAQQATTAPKPRPSARVVCCECGIPEVAWVRHTQFAGDHPFCDSCAREKPDFPDFGKESSTSCWGRLTKPAKMIPPPLPAWLDHAVDVLGEEEVRARLTAIVEAQAKWVVSNGA